MAARAQTTGGRAKKAASSKFASALQRHLSFSSLETSKAPAVQRRSTASLRSLPVTSLQRPASASTQRSAATAGPTFGSPNRRTREGKHWVSKAGRDKSASMSAALSLRAKQIHDGGLAAAAAPTAEDRWGGARRLSSAQSPERGDSSSGPATEGIRSLRKRSVQDDFKPQGNAKQVVKSSPTRHVWHTATGSKRVREELMECLVDLQSVPHLPPHEDSSGDEGEAEPQQDEQGPKVPHLPLILQVLRASQRACRHFTAMAASRSETDEELRLCKAKVAKLEEDLDAAHRTAARRSRDRRRIVVLGGGSASGGGEREPEAEAVIAELRMMLRRARADGQTIIDSKELELQRLKEQLAVVTETNEIAGQLEASKARLNALKQDASEAAAREEAAQAQLETATKRRQKAEAELEAVQDAEREVRARLAKAKRKVAKQEDELAAAHARINPTMPEAEEQQASSGGGKKGKKAKVSAEEQEARIAALMKANAGLRGELEMVKQQQERLVGDAERNAAASSDSVAEQEAALQAAQAELAALQARAAEAAAQAAGEVEAAVRRTRRECEQESAVASTRLQALQADLKAATAERDEAKLKAAQAQSRISATETKLKRALRDANQAQLARDRLQKQLDKARSGAAQAMRRAHTAEAALQKRAAEVNRLERRLLELEARLSESLGQLEATHEEAVGQAEDVAGRLAAAADRTSMAMREAQEHRAAARAAGARVGELETELAEVREQLREQEGHIAGKLREAEEVQAQASDLKDDVAAHRRSQQMAAQQLEALRGQVEHFQKQLTAERDTSRRLAEELAAARGEAEEHKQSASAATSTTVALRAKLEAHKAASSQATEASVLSATASPAAKSGKSANWARQEGIKEGKAAAARQIRNLSNQLAELRAKMDAQAQAQAASTPTRGRLKRSPSLKSMAKASKFMRHSRSASSPATPTGFSLATDDSATMGKMMKQALESQKSELERKEALLERSAAKMKEQQVFLQSWATQLAEKEREVSQRMKDTTSTLMRLHSQKKSFKNLLKNRKKA